MAQTLALVVTRTQLPAPLEAVRVLMVCACGLALACARLTI
ncbi:hypothetical protein [Novosphingobium sp. B 225]|nr:hypothetical protein [Novosphingobium sp. B 225]